MGADVIKVEAAAHGEMARHWPAPQRTQPASHPEKPEIVGTFQIPGMPIKTSDHPADLPYLAPLLGEHNAEILHGLLGTPPSEIAALVAAGVLVSGPH
jgi:crotonobetainyl-CoA:carnitine CoA-transferase CaiB-like acyl-CoA transferase